MGRTPSRPLGACATARMHASGGVFEPAVLPRVALHPLPLLLRRTHVRACTTPDTTHEIKKGLSRHKSKKKKRRRNKRKNKKAVDETKLLLMQMSALGGTGSAACQGVAQGMEQWQPQYRCHRTQRKESGGR